MSEHSDSDDKESEAQRLEFEPEFAFIINCLGLGNGRKCEEGLHVVCTYIRAELARVPQLLWLRKLLGGKVSRQVIQTSLI